MMMTDDDREMFAQAVIALARQYNIRSVALQYRDGVGSPDFGQNHHIAWASGRHGDASTIDLSYTGSKTISENSL